MPELAGTGGERSSGQAFTVVSSGSSWQGRVGRLGLPHLNSSSGCWGGSTPIVCSLALE